MHMHTVIKATQPLYLKGIHMRKAFVFAMLLIVAVAGLAPAQAAQAASQVFLYRDSTKMALASFSQTSGAIVTQVVVMAADGHAQGPPANPKPFVLSYATATILQYATACPPWQDGCTALLFAEGYTEVPRFDVGSTLSGAELNATIPMIDLITGRSFSVAVALAWSGMGDVSRVVGSPTHIREPGMIITITGNDWRRLASVTGSVIDTTQQIDYAAMAETHGELERSSGTNILVEMGL
jgi:hypothetical protein